MKLSDSHKQHVTHPLTRKQERAVVSTIMQRVAIADRVRQARQAAGLTQQTLAERAGLALRTLSRIEDGEDFRLSTLAAIADVLDLSLADLVGDDLPAA